MKNKGRKHSIKNLNKGGMRNLHRLTGITGFFKGKSTSVPEAATASIPVPSPLENSIGERIQELKKLIVTSALYRKLSEIMTDKDQKPTVYTTGYGQSGLAAQYLTGCLRCLGIRSSYFIPEGFEVVECLKVKDGDILISFGSGGGLPKSTAWDNAKEGVNQEFASLLNNIYSIGANGTGKYIEIVPFERSNLVSYKEDSKTIKEDKRSTFSDPNFQEIYKEGIKIQQDIEIKQFAEKGQKYLKLHVGVQDAFFTFIHALLLTLQDNSLAINTKPKSSDSISKEAAAVSIVSPTDVPPTVVPPTDVPPTVVSNNI